MYIRTKRNHYSAAALIAAALGVCALPQAQAQTEPKPQAQPQKQPDKAASPSQGSFYAFGGLAALAADKNSQLQNERGSPINLIAGGGYMLSPGLAAELSLLVTFRDLDTPATTQAMLTPGTYAPGTLNSSLTTIGIGATLKYSFAVDRLAPYFGGGVGVYNTTFFTTSEAPLCSNNCGGTGPRLRESSTDLGVHAVVGMDFHFTPKDLFGTELRYLKLEADFGSISPSKVDVGGALLWMGYRRIF